MHFNSWQASNNDFLWQIQEQADGSYAVYNTFGGGLYLSYVPGSYGQWLAIAFAGAGRSTWQLAPVPVFSYTFTSAGATGPRGPATRRRRP